MSLYSVHCLFLNNEGSPSVVIIPNQKDTITGEKKVLVSKPEDNSHIKSLLDAASEAISD